LRRNARPIAAVSPTARSRANPRPGRAWRSPATPLRRRVGSPRSGDRRGRPRFSWGNTWRGLFERLSDWSAHDLSKPKKINNYYQRRGTTLLRKRHLLPRNIKTYESQPAANC
jgi:hypothetical protein